MLTDRNDRLAALVDLDRSLLVEAGAGSGKTSLLAGRIACLLASGVKPSSIAAVSFTEMAASELLERISDYVNGLISGDFHVSLRLAFPEGPTRDQVRNLKEARDQLGELTCTTIHGFCQRLLKPFPVEANIDPGARIMDPAGADLAFEDVFNAWLHERLSHADAGRDLLSSLVAYNPNGAVRMIWDLAILLRNHRDVAPERATIGERPCDEFREAVAEFRAFLDGLGFEQEDTRRIVDGFGEVADAWANIHTTLPEHLQVMEIVSREIPRGLLTAEGKEGKFRQYRMKGKWEKAAPTKAAGALLNEKATALYERCCGSLGELRSLAARCGLSMLVDEIRPLIDRYQAFKREAALLDFDDLLVSTRRMLRDHPAVREALGKRFSRILVDEFQDTDPIQTDIFRYLAFDPPADGSEDMSKWRPRPGAIFFVGDPKQAIYRFRGADVHTYLATRDALRAVAPDCVLNVATNFRSCEGVLSFVNECFEEPLSSPGQPGFGRLDAVRKDHGQGPCVAAIDIEAGENASHSRDVEAQTVAELCSRLIGSYQVVDQRTGALRPCGPGDIALLAPTGTELWRYEAALEDRGIAVATQAGKGMFQRQEIQDLIAITRILADPRDSLALGAFLRGPMVGLTEEELLDISHRLPTSEFGEIEFLRVGTPANKIEHPVASQIIETLAKLRRRARETTPYEVLSQAIEDLRVRPILNARHRGNAERALANVDRFLEMARPYPVRGLRAFSDAMRRAWEDSERVPEGRPDAEEQSISLITMHSAKGLEWPIVIPVNTLTQAGSTSRFVLDVAKRRMSMPFLGIRPLGYDDAMVVDLREQQAERVRLWYVAATRARDLLILPRHAKADDKAWAAVVNLRIDDLPAIDTSSFPPFLPSTGNEVSNVQDAEEFARQQAAIEARRCPVTWRTPSRHEPTVATSERLSYDDIVMAVPETDPYLMIKGGRLRGLVLHKIIEEVLTGETEDSDDAIKARAAELSRQIASREDADPLETSEIHPEEIARTIRRTLSIPEIASIKGRLMPELVVGTSTVRDGGGETVTHGVIDAAVPKADGSGIEIVVDWKSDVRPNPRVIAQYRSQVRSYLDAVGASRGLIVFMTSGEVVPVTPRH